MISLAGGGFEVIRFLGGGFEPEGKDLHMYIFMGVLIREVNFGIVR